jgi:hypothetical protein
MKVHSFFSHMASAACAGLMGCLFAGAGLADEADRQASDNRVARGFEIAEQQGIALDHANVSAGLGSYIVNLAGCNDCHTWPNYSANGDPFARQPQQLNLPAYLAGGRTFSIPGEDVCSRNITPSKDTGEPAGLSRRDFFYVMQTGCDPQDKNFRDPHSCELLQVMPWPNYQSLTRRDLNAIYDYLSALPHAEPDKQLAQCKPDPQGLAPQ